MDARGMQKGVQQQLNAMDIPIVSEDILYYLNRAQETFIDEQYVILRGKYTDNENLELYQSAQKAIENLRTLLTTEVIPDTSITDVAYLSNASSFDLTSLEEEFYYYVRSQTQLSQNGEWVNNKLIEQEEVQKYIKTKYNDPVFRNFLVLLEGTKAIIFYDSQDGSEVYQVAFTYIKTPAEIVLSNPEDGQTTECDLPKHTHKDIVNIAVSLILEDRAGLGNPRLAPQIRQTAREVQRQREGN